jgi:hypothetical protein
VAAATLRDSSGNFLAVHSLRLPSVDANKGEALAALLAVRIAQSFGCSSLILEGDSLLSILAVTDPRFCAEWNTESIFLDIRQILSSFSVWEAFKISRCANVGAHLVAKWAASNLVFGCIPTSSFFLSSIRIRSGCDPPL